MRRLIALSIVLIGFTAHTFGNEPNRSPSRNSTVTRSSNQSGQPRADATGRQSVPVAVSRRESVDDSMIGTGVARSTSQRNDSQGVVKPASATQRVSRPVPARPGTTVRPASHGYFDGDVVYEDAEFEGGYLAESGGHPLSSGIYGSSCDSCGPSGCTTGTCGTGSGWGSCGVDLCNPGTGKRVLCIMLPSHGWVQMDSLTWWQRGMNLPPLLTSQASAVATPGLILGNEDILMDRRSGGRIRFGWWFANNPNLGIEGEYLGLGTDRFDYRAQSGGAPILARPFFNVVTGAEDAELISNPGTLSGRFTVNAYSSLDGAAVRFRKSLCCGSSCGISPLTCGPVPTQSRIDATLGWRFFQLREGLTIGEELQQTITPNSAFAISDVFETRSQFNGVEMGVLWQGRRGYWSLDTLMRVSIGNVRQTVDVHGTTAITTGGVTENYDSGILVQRTNRGTYIADSLGVIPEFGATLGYQLTPRWRLTAGYTFIYWNRVVRPGDQIDTDLNPNLFPPETVPLTGALRPRFRMQETDYWVQGLNLGAEYKW